MLNPPRPPAAIPAKVTVFFSTALTFLKLKERAFIILGCFKFEIPALFSRQTDFSGRVFRDRGSVFSRELTVETSTRTKSNVNAAFSVVDKLSPGVTAHQNYDSLLVPKDHVSRSNMAQQPQVDVKAGVKALFAAGVKLVAIDKEGVTQGVTVLNSYAGFLLFLAGLEFGNSTTMPGGYEDGDATQSNVVAWINAAGPGPGHVVLTCDDDFKAYGYF